MTGTATGIVVLAWMPHAPSLTQLQATLSCSLLLLLWRRNRLTRFAVALCLGACYAGQHLDKLPDLGLPYQGEAEVRQIHGLVLAPAEIRQFSGGGRRQRFILQLDEYPGCNLLLSYYGDTSIRAGQRWALEARLKPPWGLSNPGSFNFQAWLIQNRYCATGYVRERSLRLLGNDAAALPWYQRARQQLQDDLAKSALTNTGRGLAQALAIGERSAIPVADWQVIKGLGLSHLFVVSGLHVGLVAGIGFGLGKLLVRLGGGYAWPQLCSLALAGSFAALAGFGLPAQRALVMLVSLQLALLCRRRLDGGRALLIAAWAVNVLDPLCTHNPGFWLSFAAVALIIFLLRRWPLLPGWRHLLQIQLVLSLGLGTFASFWFGGLSLVSPLANLLVVPLVSFVLVPASLLLVLWLAVTASVPAVLVGLFNVSGVVLAWFDATSWLAWQQAWLQFQPSAGALVLAVIGAWLLALFRRQPWALLGCCLLLPLWSGAQPLPLPEGELKITVFDVGQGLAVLVQTADYRLLYDTGAGDPAGFNMANSVLLPFLRQRGISGLNTLVISHSDRDHASGVATLAAQLRIDELLYGDARQPVELLQQACQRGGFWRAGDLLITQLHPIASSNMADDNEQSCVLMLDFHGYRILLPGDIGRRSELELVQYYGNALAADVLVVPHHGSGNSSSGPFLRQVAPRIAVVSAGFLNRFGHPRPAVLAAYRRIGARLYNTAEDGALELRIRGGELVSISAHREGTRAHWL